MPGLADWVERVTRSRITKLECLPPGAGRRRYFRVTLARGETRVVMHARPEDPAILPPALRHEEAKLPFVEVTRLLARFDLPVPRIHVIDPVHRWILLEDLGDVHLCDLEGETLARRLEEAGRLLARVHAIPCEELPFDRTCDVEWVSFELRHFVEYAVPPDLRDATRAALDALVERVASLPRSLCLRDYQSQNLMIDPAGRLRVLDYQDALAAPPELDLAALLYDSYLEIEPALRSTVLRAYEEARGTRGTDTDLWILVLQRKCKDLARFRYLVEVRGDARYARFRARARGAALEALAHLDTVLGPSAGVLRRTLEAAPA